MSFWFRQLFGVFNFIANVVAIATVAPPSSLFKNIIEPVCSKKKKGKMDIQLATISSR
jgi:hypothetical protein